MEKQTTFRTGDSDVTKKFISGITKFDSRSPCKGTRSTGSWENCVKATGALFAGYHALGFEVKRPCGTVGDTSQDH